jgi:cell fate (sporulation/competence/biofilm development) regulator YlbF (YheA/YmcA/DUF963 family)
VRLVCDSAEDENALRAHLDEISVAIAEALEKTA